MITTSWMTHSTDTQTNDRNPRNFQKINKFAVCGGMVTSRDFIKYKKEHESSNFRIAFGLSSLKVRDNSVPFAQSFSYGRANRPQTPVKGIILNSYGETAGAQLQDKYRDMQVYKKTHSPTNNKFSITCTNA